MVNSWTTGSDTTNTWIYRSADPVYSTTDSSFTTSNITVSNLIWRIWNETYQHSLSRRWEIHGVDPQPYVLTPEEIEAERQRERERQRRHAEREQHRLLIKTRADRLLRWHLTPEQRASLDRHGHFIVIGESGKRYRIRHGYMRNIDLLDANGKAVKTYCAHPGENLPVGDPRDGTAVASLMGCAGIRQGSQG
jgi:hypothetical protein